MPAKTPESSRIFLNHVHLKGFKSIDDLSIDFQKGLNILIGKNGSGKSNFMEFLHDVILINSNSKPFYNYAKLKFITSDDHSFEIILEKELIPRHREDDIDDRKGLIEKFLIDGEIAYDSTDNGTAVFGFKNKVKFKNRDFFYRSNLRVSFIRLGYQAGFPLYVRFSLPDNLECINVPGTLKVNIEQEYGLWEYPKTLNFISNILFGLEARFEESVVIKKMVEKGFYKQLQSNLPNNILENLKLYSSIEDIRFNNNLNIYNDEKSLIIENIKLDFRINGNWLPWSQLSDGTKRLFYIISEVTTSNGLVLIEEPELGIHPHQFNLLMNFLKEQSESKQIIISTHAPKALDHLSPNELNHILLTYYDRKKGTQMRHLTSKEIKKANRYMKEVGFFSDYWLLSDLEE